MLLPFEYHFPDKVVSYKQLDKLLATGYFRTGNYLMRTRVLFFNNEILNTLHVRFQLSDYLFSKSLQKLLHKNKQRFTYTIQPFSITIEKENLYRKHRTRFKGHVSPSLSGYMFDNYHSNIFNTYEINVFDGEQLVAFSFFDVGHKSIASILGIFNQEYEKFSLGIYTMLLEIEYAKNLQFKYYYPGYVAYEPSQFNYKLRLAKKIQFFDWFTKRWLSFENRNKKIKVYDFFTEKMNIAATWLEKFKIEYKPLFYPFFYMGGVYPKSDCVKSILHYLVTDFEIEGLYYIIEFHPEKMQLMLTGATIHKYSYEDEIDYTDVFDEKEWKRVLLYLHPSIIISNEFELYAGLLFPQDLFRQYLLPPPIPNNRFQNPNLFRS